MRRLCTILAGVSALLGAVLTSGCGPGLVALMGGGTGTFFGLQGSGDEKKKDKKEPPAPTTNVAPAVIVTALARGDSPVNVSYTILDANSDQCSIEVQYSTGGPFADCFPGAGGDGTTGLSSSPAGNGHTFSWESFADLGPQLTTGVTLRIRANDGQVTGSWNELSGLTVGNNPPALDNITYFNTGGIVLFTFTVADENNDAATLDLAYSIDQGQSFVPIDTDPGSGTYELLGNPPLNLATSPAGSPSQLIWDSTIALPDYQGQVLLLFTPRDHPAGFASPLVGPSIVAGPYSLDNHQNGPPQLSIVTDLDGQLFVGKVPFQVAVSDAESDPAAVVVVYSLDDGVNWYPATLVNQFQPGVAGPFPAGVNPTIYDIVWDALADMDNPPPPQVGYLNDWSNVRIAAIPVDSQQGEADVSEPFSVRGNSVPVIVQVGVLQDSGNVPVVVRISDEGADPVSLAISYSTDGNAYSPLPPAAIIVGDPAAVGSSVTGHDNVLIWDSSLTFPNQNHSTVYLRFTPTDHPASAPSGAADMTGSAFTSSPFPIINNPAGTDPVSITVFTTDAGGAPTANPVVTVQPGAGPVYFDREVFPSSAIANETLWKILQTGDDWGSLETVGGASLTYATGSFTLSGSAGLGDVFTVHDGLNSPVQLELWQNGNPLGINSVPVDIGGMSTSDEYAQALANAINALSNIRWSAVFAGAATVDLTHTIACRVGNAASADPGRGNASDITASPPSSLAAVTQMDGGNGTQRMRFLPPATAPAGSTFVDLYCEIDHPNFWYSVQRSYRLYWGTAPQSVSINADNPPGATTVLVSTPVELSATVLQATAPQHVVWSVDGGSTNGTITQGGRYTAPPTVPNPAKIYVRATAVNGVSGTYELTVQPMPTSIAVSSVGSGPLLLDGQRAFTAVVSPSGAPQGVNWRVWWNGSEHGQGNSQVGMIDSSGQYTAPHFLPNPPQVIIQAVSQVNPSVVGGQVQDLQAPPPNSFALSPPTATVFAGGSGQQFTPVNPNPDNANMSVTWELSPVVGTLINGFYTPPATVPSQTQVTITARSTANTAITAPATVTVMPVASVTPTGVTISPPEGTTFSAGPFIQFSATVDPPGANPNINWTIQGTQFGSIDNTGRYTPGTTTIDRTVTIRATAATPPNPFDEVEIVVAGSGRNWVDNSNFELARSSPNMVWDNTNQRMWMIGGKSPNSSLGKQERLPVIIETGGGGSIFAANIVGGPTYLGDEPNTIAACLDSTNNRIVAILGQGPVSRPRVFALPLNVQPLTWVDLAPPVVGDAPTLGGTFTYHCWYDASDKEVLLLYNTGEIYRFSCDLLSANPNQWLSKRTVGKIGSGPTVVELCGMSYHPASRTAYFVGPSSNSSGASMEVYRIAAPSWQWDRYTSAGSKPPGGIKNPAVLHHAGRLHVFSGQRSSDGVFVQQLFNVELSGTDATWTEVTQGTEERPLPRGDAGFAEIPGSGFVLYGGETALGSHGDVYEFTLGATNPPIFRPLNINLIRPQGRKHAAGVMVSSKGYIYGGLCDHGVSNELWEFEWNNSESRGEWTRLETTGTRPPQLWGASMTYHENQDMIVLFGGDTGPPASPAVTNLMFTLNLNTMVWSQVSQTGSFPGGRRGAAFTYDPDNNRIWMFGGETNTVRVNDCRNFVLNSATSAAWASVVSPSGDAPDARAWSTLGWNEKTGRLLLLGGENQASGANNHLYQYNPGANHWSILLPSNAGAAEPVARSGAVFDREIVRFIHAPASRGKAEALVMCTPGPEFQFLATPPSGNNGTGTTGLYDESEQRYFVLFGERNVGGKSTGTNMLRTVEFK